MRLGESPRMFPPAFGKRPSPLPLSREGRGVRTLILASLLPLREKDRMSVYDKSQAHLGASACQKRSWVMSVLAMTTSFRITAVRATLGSFPAAVRRS